MALFFHALRRRALVKRLFPKETDGSVICSVQRVRFLLKKSCLPVRLFFVHLLCCVRSGVISSVKFIRKELIFLWCWM